jgi:hypothetical protein
MRNILFITVLITLFSCGNKDTENEKKEKNRNSELKNENTSENTEQEKTRITDLSFDIKIDEKQTSFKGEIVASASWNDARGKNILIISEKPQYFWNEENPAMRKLCKDPENESEVCELFAFHYVWSDEENKWKKYWTINDFLFGCCDVYMNYQKESLKIEDSDEDGKAETVFFYTIGQGTNSIDRYFKAKLIYHPDDTKLKAEGTTGAGKEYIETPDMGIKPVAVKFEGFTGANEKWKSNAEKYWKECHERQLKIDEIILDEQEKLMENAE